MEEQEKMNSAAASNPAEQNSVQQPDNRQAPQQPAYQQPVYQQAPQQPVYQQPAYQQAPQQPVYQQPAYQQAPQQPAYQQPAYQQAPQQPAYQQPVYQQAPQQPAYQQPAYQQAPQQPAYQQPAYQQAPQQPAYQQPAYRPQPAQNPAINANYSLQAQKAVLAVGGSILMLVLCILQSVGFFGSFVKNLMTFDIFGMIGAIFDALILTGLWLIWAKSRAKKFSPGGIKLIKVPLVILFIFFLIGSVFSFIGNIITLNILGLFVNLIKEVVVIMFYVSIFKVLNFGFAASTSGNVTGPASGMFAAIMLMIMALVNLISDLLFPSIFEVIMGIIGGMGSLFGSDELAVLAGGSLAFTYVMTIFSFLVNIYAGVLIIMFNIKVKKG